MSDHPKLTILWLRQDQTNQKKHIQASNRNTGASILLLGCNGFLTNGDLLTGEKGTRHSNYLWQRS